MVFVWFGVVCFGVAWRGVAWRGVAWRGVAGLDWAGLGLVRSTATAVSSVHRRTDNLMVPMEIAIHGSS